jgi:hypothetical protein
MQTRRRPPLHEVARRPSPRPPRVPWLRRPPGERLVQHRPVPPPWRHLVSDLCVALRHVARWLRLPARAHRCAEPPAPARPRKFEAGFLLQLDDGAVHVVDCGCFGWGLHCPCAPLAWGRFVAPCRGVPCCCCGGRSSCRGDVCSPRCDGVGCGPTLPRLPCCTLRGRAASRRYCIGRSGPRSSERRLAGACFGVLVLR